MELQVRNKPIEPPKKPEKAPFFLPSIPSLSGEIQFKPSEMANMEDTNGDVNKSHPKKADYPASQFLQLLHSSADNDNCKSTSFFCDLMSLFLVKPISVHPTSPFYIK